MRRNATLGGIVMFATAVALFATLDTTAKWLMSTGLAALQVAFVRYAGHLVATLAVTLPRQGLGVLRSVDPRLQLARSLCLLGSTGLNFVALSYLPLTTVTAIMFASPVIVTLLAVPLPGRTRVASIAIYDEVQSLHYAQANAYALTLLVIAFAILVSLYWFTKKDAARL